MKKIGIIGAMELEVETLKSKMNVAKTTKKANMEFFEGTLNGVEVVIGTVPEWVQSLNLPLVKGRDYLYAAGIITQDIIQID